MVNAVSPLPTPGSAHTQPSTFLRVERDGECLFASEQNPAVELTFPQATGKWREGGTGWVSSSVNSADCSPLRQTRAQAAAVWSRNWPSQETLQGGSRLSAGEFCPSWWQPREWKYSPRGTLGLTTLPWAGRGQWELVLSSPQSLLLPRGTGVRVGDKDTSCMCPVPPPLPPSASPRKLPAGIPGRRTQTLDRQTGTLFVPGLGHQFGEKRVCIQSPPPWPCLGLAAQGLKANRVK